MRTALKKLPGYIGYLIGSFFITAIWLAEKVIIFFKSLKRRNTKYNNGKKHAGSEIDT